MTSLLIALFAYGVLLTTASCPEDQEPQFCQSNDNIPQMYCDTVDQQKEWLCKKRSYGKCACKDGLYRRKDGKCVPKKDCDAKSEEDAPKPQIPTSSGPYGELEIPEDLQGSPEDIYKVLNNTLWQDLSRTCEINSLFLMSQKIVY